MTPFTENASARQRRPLEFLSTPTPAPAYRLEKGLGGQRQHQPIPVVKSMPPVMTRTGDVSPCERALCRRLRLCWLVHPYTFPEEEMEAIFQQYYIPLWLLNFSITSFLAFLIHLGMHVILWTSRPGDSGHFESRRQRLSFALDVAIGLPGLVFMIASKGVLLRVVEFGPKTHNLKIITVPSIILLVLLAVDCFLITDHAFAQPKTPTTALWYVAIVVLMINSKLYINLLFNLIVSVLLATSWIAYVAFTSDVREAVHRQVIASSLLLYLCIAFGVTYRLLFERWLRRLFYDTTRRIAVASRLKQETGHQRSLLLSIFPDSVALEMTEEVVHNLEEHFIKFGVGEADLPFLLSADPEAQFQKCFMARCDKASILCANIVAFTETSSTMSPLALVAMLNDVFARFDIMAQEEGCDRIKILGDSYVCVAGVPQHCVDHADRCVRTGSRFVKEIGIISRPHGKSLRLRVGIHSGAVLCGVLGLKKWSFDIWGNDVSIASLLESTGKAGCIHISAATRRLLDDLTDYIIEDADPVTHNGHVIGTGFVVHLGQNDIWEKVPLPQDQDPNRFNSHHPFSDFRPVRTSVDSEMFSSEESLPLSGNKGPRSSVSTGVVEVDFTVSDHNLQSPSRVEFPHLGRDIAGIDVDEVNEQQTRSNERRASTASEEQQARKEAYEQLAKEMDVGAAFREYREKVTLGMLRFKEKYTSESYYKRPDQTFEINMIIYALINLVLVSVIQLAVMPKIYSRLCGYIVGSLSSLVIILLVLKRLSRRVGEILQPVMRKICTSFSAQMVISLVSFTLINCTIDLAMIPCWQQAMEPRVTHLGHCSLLKNSTIAQCILLNFEQVEVSSSSCRPAKSFPPNVMSAGNSFEHVFCNATNDVHGYRLPVPISPQDDGCDFPHLINYAKMCSLIMMVIIYRLPLAWMMLTAVLFGGLSLILTLTIYRLPYTDAYFYWIQVSDRPDLPPYFEHTSIFFVVVSLLTIIAHGRPLEVIIKVSHLWYEKYYQITRQIQQLHQANVYLLHNILPKHVAVYYLSSSRTRGKELYSCYHRKVAVMFCSIPDFAEAFYNESATNHHGIECLRLLNEIFADWDKLLSKPAYSGVEKIKTIGPTYMLVAGLDQPGTQHCPADMLADYARSMFDVITEINMHAFQNFKLRIGLHVGPVVSGVIGAKKPLFDIWGDTVNVASRMDSTGVGGKIQVTTATAAILRRRGYTLERRGEVFVKSKGQVVTHFISKWPEREAGAPTTALATPPSSIPPSPSPPPPPVNAASQSPKHTVASLDMTSRRPSIKISSI